MKKKNQVSQVQYVQTGTGAYPVRVFHYFRSTHASEFLSLQNILKNNIYISLHGSINVLLESFDFNQMPNSPIKHDSNVENTRRPSSNIQL